MTLIFTEIKLGISIIIPAEIFKPFKAGFCQETENTAQTIIRLLLLNANVHFPRIKSDQKVWKESIGSENIKHTAQKCI